MRTDVYNAVKAFAATPEAGSLTGERARYLTVVLRDYTRNGMDLEPASRGESIHRQRACAPSRCTPRVPAHIRLHLIPPHTS